MIPGPSIKIAWNLGKLATCYHGKCKVCKLAVKAFRDGGTFLKYT